MPALSNWPPIEQAIIRNEMLWRIELHAFDERVAAKFGWPPPRSTQQLRDAMRIMSGRMLTPTFRDSPMSVQLFCPSCGAGVGDTLQRIDRCFKCGAAGPWVDSWGGIHDGSG